MRVDKAMEAARDLAGQYENTPGYVGAYFSGSVLVMAPDAELPPASDVDLCVVLEGDAPMKPGKLVHKGALVEVSFLAWESIRDPERLLGTYELAGSFRSPEAIVSDPWGKIGAVQRAVAERFAELPWIRARYRAALEKIRRGIAGNREATDYPDKVNSWLFPTGITTHVLLAAGLRNPTVRLRYKAARALLLDTGHGGFYAPLLDLLDPGPMAAERVAFHVDRLAETFDLAARAAKTPFFFSSDISARCRPIAIAGSRELIADGLHREALFWVAATFARCQKILDCDAPALAAERLPHFRALLADLGLETDEDFAARCRRTLDFLPELSDMAERIAIQSAARRV